MWPPAGRKPRQPYFPTDLTKRSVASRVVSLSQVVSQTCREFNRGVRRSGRTLTGPESNGIVDVTLFPPPRGLVDTGYLPDSVTDAAGWIAANYPALGNATDYLIETLLPLPGDVQADGTLPGVIRLDLSKIETDDDMVRAIAHELMHKRLQTGIEPLFDDLMFDGDFHEYIYQRAEEIRREYERQKREWERREQCRER